MALQTIPACHGVAIELDVGSQIVVINTYGTQVLDTWAFSVADPAEYLSMEHTRSRLSRLSPGAGDS
ncbi:MAG: urea carboxylase-associated family protein, partial [Gammaproteobacteria bacterium]|nr:urea carboxylase-associated family protein [Gammaproteobacteria bacterium]